MNITPDEARVALNDIQQGTVKARILYNGWAYYLLLWGLVWTIGFLATQVQPQFAGWIWGVMVGIGIVGSGVLGFLQSRRTRVVPGTRSAFINSRLGIFYGVLYAFAILWLIVFPFTAVQIGLFWIMIVAFGSIIAGVWMSERVSIGLGIGMTVMAMLGYSLVPHYFWLWSAVFAGLPLVCVSVYYLLLRKSL